MSGLMADSWRGLAKGILFSAVTAWLFFDLEPFSFLLFLSVPLFVISDRKRCEEERLTRTSEAFRDACSFMKNALEAGNSPENALLAATQGLEGLYGKNARITLGFRNMYTRLHFGYSMEEALNEFSEKMKHSDIQSFVDIFPVLKRTGGDLCKVLQSTVMSLRNRLFLKKELNVAIAGKMGEFRIMCIIPYAMLLYLRSCSPELAASLYHNAFGCVFMGSMLFLEVVSYMIGKRIIRKVFML